VMLMQGRRAVSTARAESVAKHRLGAFLQAMGDAKEGATGPMAEDHAEDLARGWLMARQQHSRHVLRQLGGSLTLGVLANAGVLLVGGALVMDGQLTVGQLVAAELVVSALAEGLSKLGKYLETFYDVLAAAEKLGHLQDIELDEASGGPHVQEESHA
jgi:putative ABC transport system ATP-binding protein